THVGIYLGNGEFIHAASKKKGIIISPVHQGYYTGDPKSFKEVIEYCPVPYVVLSGPASDDPEIFLKFVQEAIGCGAAGVSVGRNVWTYKDPTTMTRALCRLVHEEASVEEAMKEL
ncbi:MAG TPA: fructose-bisphosphate aldolase, partial [Candidatus Latescibacteria bacterium]|nr:fructose-bisphosphate aldolase [Candidatus Latescibacterota bacterium]